MVSGQGRHRDQAHIKQKSKRQHHIVYTDIPVARDRIGFGVNVKHDVTIIPENSVL